MNKVASAYLVYGFLISLIGVATAILISGPSRALILALGLVLIYRGIRASKQETSERTYLTLFAALSPGVIHLTTIRKESGNPKDVLIGILLMMGFFGGISMVALTVVPGIYGIDLIPNPFPVMASSIVIIVGCYEISVISVNQYCDMKGYPCSEEMFEYSYENPSRLIKIVLVLTVVVAIAVAILAGYIVSLNPE